MKFVPSMNTLRIGWLGYCLLAAASLMADDDHSIVVDASGEKFSINGTQFLPRPSVDDLVELWGPPDRLEKLANDIRIWDELGVRAYSNRGGFSVDSLAFTMRKQDRKLAAKSAFAGTIRVPEGALTNQSTLADLERLGFTPNPALSKFQDLDLPMISFLAEIDEEAGGTLVSLSLKFTP